MTTTILNYPALKKEYKRLREKDQRIQKKLKQYEQEKVTEVRAEEK